MATPAQNPPAIQNNASNYGEIFIHAANEIIRLMPDSLLFGTLVLYFLTQNLSYGILCVFIFETVIGHRIISWLFSQSIGDSRPTSIQDAKEKIKCRSGFLTPESNTSRIFQHGTYPSYGLFSISSLSSYFLLGMNDYAPTFDSMDTAGSNKYAWSTRVRVSAYSIGILLFVLICSRLYKECDTLGGVLVAVVLGLLFGWFGYIINSKIFGLESMNFLGLPYMKSRKEDGNPIYVCNQVQG
jgi:hypothetical protein